MLELRILVDDIDYDSIAEYLIPAVAEKLRREEKGGILGNVLAGNPDMAASVARTVLGTMSQEQKDQLLVQLVTKNREKLLDKGNQAVRSRRAQRALAAKDTTAHTRDRMMEKKGKFCTKLIARRPPSAAFCGTSSYTACPCPGCGRSGKCGRSGTASQPTH